MTGFDLKKFLKTNDITQEKAAELLNVDRRTVNKWCNMEEEDRDIGNKILILENYLSELNREETSQNYSKITKEDMFSVPLIPFEAIAGFGGSDNEAVRYEDCDRYVVPEFITNGVEFVVRVSGSSMYPKYSNGDILACKKIYDILFFQWGKVYVIDSSQGVLVKRVFEYEDENYILLVSDNKEKYPPFKIPKSDIRSLSIVLGVIRME